MKIATTTSVFPAGYDVIKAVDRLAHIGYTSLDLAFDYCTTEGNPFLSDAWEHWAWQLRDHAENRGVAFTHAHAAYDARGQDPAVERTMRCAQILGCRYLVVHPAWRTPDGRIYEDHTEFLEVNRKLYTPLVEKAKQYSIILLTENLLWGSSVLPNVISELVMQLDSPHFGWCYDTGHANCFGIRPSTLMGLPCPPASLHVQDNHGEQKDEHLLPGDGTVDWEEFLQTLAAIGYAGEFVLEAHHQSLDAPDAQREKILLELLNRSKKMVARLETLRKQ